MFCKLYTLNKIIRSPSLPKIKKKLQDREYFYYYDVLHFSYEFVSSSECNDKNCRKFFKSKSKYIIRIFLFRPLYFSRVHCII